MDKIQVTRSSMPEIEEYINEIKELWETRWLTNSGAKHRTLEAQLCDYLEVKNTTLFCNGHLALYTALKALNLKGEVITTPFTFASTTHAIVQAGLTPVFCDIDPNNYTIDVNKIEELITPQTCAILPVHVYGNICDVYKIEEIAKKYNLKVIYDAAHAFGVKLDGKGIGTFGDISMFSFHATKVFNTVEGGAVVYKDDLLKEKLDVFKNFGITSPETVDEVGINAKMNEFSAAMGICNLKHIEEYIAKRKIAYDRYRENLKNVRGIQLLQFNNNISPNYAYFPVVFDKEIFGKDRDEITKLLQEHNIFARKYFYPLTSEFSCYKNFKADTPIAKKISENVLTLPLYEGLTVEEVDRICDLIKEVA